MPFNKKYIDRSAGIDEYVAETADEAALRGMYQNNVTRMSGMNNYWARIGRAKFDGKTSIIDNGSGKITSIRLPNKQMTADGDVYEPSVNKPSINEQSFDPANKAYLQNLSQLEQWKSEQYGEQQKAYETSVGKLDESLTKSIASGRKSLDEYNKKQREQAKYDISQAYQYYLQQQQAIMGTPTLSEGSKEYLESQVGDTTATAKAKVEQNLKETLNTAQTQFEENVAEATADVEDRKAELKETYESNLAEIDKTFETNKSSLESMRDSSFSSADYQKTLTTNFKDYSTSVTETDNLFNSFASEEDLEKSINKVNENVTKLRSDYEKADKLATEWENKASTTAEKSYAKSLRAIADNAKKLYEQGIKQYNTYLEQAKNYESTKLAAKEKIRKTFESSAIYNQLKKDYGWTDEEIQQNLYSSGELTELGKELYATAYAQEYTGFKTLLEQAGFTEKQVHTLLGIDSSKVYKEKSSSEIIQEKKTLDEALKIPTIDVVGVGKTAAEGDSIYVGTTQYNKSSKVNYFNLDITAETAKKIPAGTVFKANTIKVTNQNPEIRKDMDELGLKWSANSYSKGVATETQANQLVDKLLAKGYDTQIKPNAVGIYIVYVTGGTKESTLYKSSDGNIYYLN